MKGKKNEGKLSDHYADQTVSARQRGRLILIWMCWCSYASGFCLNVRALDNPKGDVAHSTMGAKIPLCSCPAIIVIYRAACWWLMPSICRRTPLWISPKRLLPCAPTSLACGAPPPPWISAVTGFKQFWAGLDLHPLRQSSSILGIFVRIFTSAVSVLNCPRKPCN